MGEERDGSYAYYDETTKDAADICGRCQETSEAAKRTEPVSRQERANYSGQVRAIDFAAFKKRVLQNHLFIIAISYCKDGLDTEALIFFNSQNNQENKKYYNADTNSEK